MLNFVNDATKMGCEWLGTALIFLFPHIIASKLLHFSECRKKSKHFRVVRFWIICMFNVVGSELNFLRQFPAPKFYQSKSHTRWKEDGEKLNIFTVKYYVHWLFDFFTFTPGERISEANFKSSTFFSQLG